MAPIRVGVLARFVAAGLVPVQIGAVPVTDTWLIKDVRVWNPTGVTHLMQAFALDPTGLIRTYIFYINSANISVAQVGIGLALGPGDTVWFGADAVGCGCWISGVDLPGHL